MRSWIPSASTPTRYLSGPLPKRLLSLSEYGVVSGNLALKLGIFPMFGFVWVHLPVQVPCPLYVPCKRESSPTLANHSFSSLFLLELRSIQRTRVLAAKGASSGRVLRFSSLVFQPYLSNLLFLSSSSLVNFLLLVSFRKSLCPLVLSVGLHPASHSLSIRWDGL